MVCLTGWRTYRNGPTIEPNAEPADRKIIRNDRNEEAYIPKKTEKKQNKTARARVTGRGVFGIYRGRRCRIRFMCTTIRSRPVLK